MVFWWICVSPQFQSKKFGLFSFFLCYIFLAFFTGICTCFWIRGLERGISWIYVFGKHFRFGRVTEHKVHTCSATRSWFSTKSMFQHHRTSRRSWKLYNTKNLDVTIAPIQTWTLLCWLDHTTQQLSNNNERKQTHMCCITDDEAKCKRSKRHMTCCLF